MFGITLWFALGTLGMTVGTAVLAYGFRLLPESRHRRYAIVVSIPAIAILAYAVMALGYGEIRAAGHAVYIPRYVDWFLTTPLNVLVLGLLAGSDRETLAQLVGLQSLTIAFGFAGSVLPDPWTWVGFAFGFVCFAGVVRLLYGQIGTDAAGTLAEVEFGLYRTLRNFVVVLWLVYPVIWVLGPPGVLLMDIETTSLVITYIDVVTKVGFGLIALNGWRVMATEQSPRDPGMGVDGRTNGDDSTPGDTGDSAPDAVADSAAGDGVVGD